MALTMTHNSLEVLKKRYLLKDDRQKVVETPAQLFRRVARHVAAAEAQFRPAVSSKKTEEDFFRAMQSLDFLPNSPTLMNAGTSLGQLSACFVLPVEDSIDAIFKSLTDMARIHQTGGGTGFGFSRLRPKGDLVRSTKGAASGPVSFMSIFDQATGVIVQGGRRRGANMGILRCDHPDIIEFIEAKNEKGRFSNFNLSVGATDAFMEAVLEDRAYALVNPRTKKRARAVRARVVFGLIAKAAWRTGDPGLVFLDEINRENPTPSAGLIEATNPCGELPLLPYESCNLASINLAKLARKGTLDRDKLKDLVHLGVRFLDDVIEVNKFPLPEIRRITFANRKIGLGVMGFADLLIRLNIPYNSARAQRFAATLMKFIHRESLAASSALARERGVFPNHNKSRYAGTSLVLRNATVNTIAPTGTISIIAGCSSGIEPLFAVAFVRHVLSGEELFEVNRYFRAAALKGKFYSRGLMERISRTGSLGGFREVPGSVKKIFVTAFDTEPMDHLRIQAAFQRYTDNSVSKTINLPQEATVDDVRRIYLAAYKLRLKGITVYRYGSKEEQVLTFGEKRKGKALFSEPLIAGSEYSGGCASGVCPF